MAIPWFLAMTGAEFTAAETLPEHVAWMACHFSPYGNGLTNLPASLPPDSLLILNDRIPICGHDPDRIAAQLRHAVDTLRCCGILLDFQHAHVEETARLCAALTAALPCPVAVSDCYAAPLDCPVFLSPCSHHVPLDQHILPWQGRKLWLDLASNFESILLTKDRSQITSLPFGELPESGHADSLLHCHYSIETSTDSVLFTLWRTWQDMAAIAETAEALGVETLVGLYSECHGNCTSGGEDRSVH